MKLSDLIFSGFNVIHALKVVRALAILDRRIHYFVMYKFYRIRLKLRNTIFFFFFKLNEVFNHINDLG